MNWDFTIAPLLPWPLLLAILAVGLVFIAITVVTRGRGWILRGAALALLLLALLNPSLRKEDRENLSDIAIAVVDQSRSQSFGEWSRMCADWDRPEPWRMRRATFQLESEFMTAKARAEPATS